MTIQYQSAIPLNFNRGDISLMANELFKSLNFRHKNLENAIKDFNGKVVYMDGVSNFNFSSLQVSPEGFTVYISRDTTPARDRVDLATAIGHWVLHYLYPNKHSKNIEYLKIDQNTDKMALCEAHWFGASLLMPKQEYISVHKQYDGDHLIIADYFKVPYSASLSREISLQDSLSLTKKVKLASII